MRQRLKALAADLFTPFGASDQRAKVARISEVLLDGRRKSMQPMANRLGVDHQGLQQFVTTSTWGTTAVRMRLAVWTVEVVGPVAWVVDVTGLPKDGNGSLGVAISSRAAAAASPADRRDQPAPRGTTRSCDPRPTVALPFHELPGGPARLRPNEPVSDTRHRLVQDDPPPLKF
ncbi:transposase [Micromonospora sp. NPDC048947]|uniref:transposase n=1 Tax=Micromonospora sp. NPDC048947 TaxID=3154826 RepID=UPI0033D6447C